MIQIMGVVTHIYFLFVGCNTSLTFNGFRDDLFQNNNNF